MLGSNILVIPVVVSVAYWASRASFTGNTTASTEEEPAAHERHRSQGLLRVERQAITVQALPYLGIVAAVALLTLPAPRRRPA